MLYVPKGRYHILAFADHKKDGTYDAGNLIGRYAAQGCLTIAAGQVCGGVDILLDSGGVPAADFKGPLRMTSKQRISVFNADNDTPLNLDDRHFARQFGTLGLWEPSRFIDTVGVNIYCLEPYQAQHLLSRTVSGVQDSGFVYTRLRRNPARLELYCRRYR
jgi:hypothetical protein